MIVKCQLLFQPKENYSMKKKDVIKHFGGLKKTADALGIWPQAVYKWPDEVPKATQYRIQVITKGALMVDEGDCHEH